MAVVEEPGPKPLGDYRNILAGTSQNVVGIAIAGAATFAANVLLTRTLREEGFGIVTVMTQAAFVLSFATRAGMDMAVLRDVAVETGVKRWDRIRVPVARATLIATLVSVAIGVALILGRDSVLSLFSIDEAEGDWLVESAALGLPFLALTNVWLSATRGLKIMRYTLYVFWAGQPLLWIVLLLLGWQFAQTTWMSVLAYSLSWAVAAIGAGYFWRRESRAWVPSPMEPGALSRLMRYAGPRAPAALFSQLLFWTDLFVLTNYASDAEVGVYAAALRAGQVLVLLLTSVSLMFSPFVADLHNRGESDRLDRLFKTLTRWTIIATMPIFLVLAIAPEPTLRIFGSEFAGGQVALLILIAGQFINVATGSVGFVLIMVGRTGWDLVVYGASLVMNLGLAFWLCPRYGMEGAAIANAATFAASKWARLALVKRFVHIQPYDRQYLRLLAPTAAGAAVMWVVHKALDAGWLLDLLATAGLGTLVYVVVHFAIGLAPAERREVNLLLSRVRGGAHTG